MSRYQELLEDLSRLSEVELRSYALDVETAKVIEKVIAYKRAKGTACE